jgi:FtsP/CotA-like multicopper oxidase with cupredoxin domain
MHFDAESDQARTRSRAGRGRHRGFAIGTGVVFSAVLLVLVAPSAEAQRGAGGPGGGGIFVPPESDGPLLEPPVIRSKNGVLKADVALIRAGAPGSNRPTLFGGLPVYSNPDPAPTTPQPPARPPHFPLNFAAGYRFTNADGRTYPAQFPGPTLRVNPGDTLDLRIRNRLADERSGPRLPAEASLTNVHSHGMVVGPLGDSDNVFRTMESDGSYRTRIKIPEGHHSGYQWYHPHRHGFVADQVYGGLAGSVLVGSPLDPWPRHRGRFRERLVALTAGIFTVDPDSGLRFVDDPAPTDDPGPQGNPNPYGSTWRKYVNGQYNPTITIRPGETQVWTFASMVRNGNFNLGVTDANGQNPWSATILSYDGNSSRLHPRATTLALPIPYVYNGPTVLDDGARITMAVTAPTTPGTYYLVDNMTLKLRPQAQAFALATIKVEGSPVAEPRPVFPPTGKAPDVFTATPDHKRTFIFSNDTSGRTIRFPINGTLFPNVPIVPLQVGQVEEWLLVNSSPVDHIFHIHQTNFAVVSVNTTPVDYQNPFTAAAPNRYVSLRDSVNIPPGGSVVVRFRVSRQLGKYVFHCHILPHEDGGMMMPVLALPNPGQRRIALGTSPGRRNAVLVQDGHGRALGRIRPSPRNARGGVAAATGDVNGDLIEDIVVGPARPGSSAFVSVYDGRKRGGFRRTKRFRPFPKSRRAGLSLATGDIDRDGRAEIVVGRVGRGTSLVRVFRANGKLFREIRGALPGRFPNGVAVTSADFNGDNYDDLAIGAGRGRAPRVVGLDGFALGGPSRGQRERLFSFLAAGGRTAGLNLAAGYYDPRTRPGPFANLITTPQTGPRSGTVRVWAPREAAEHAAVGHAHSAAAGSPRLMATLRPLQRRVRGLRLAVTRLGEQGVNALVAWADPRRPAYLSINDEGVVFTLRTPPRPRPRATASHGTAERPTAGSGAEAFSAGIW